jgi:zinc/manganese transport system substrate-binding protein
MNMIVNSTFIRWWRRAAHPATCPGAVVRSSAAAVLAPVAALIALAACGSNSNDSASTTAAGDSVRVVASTNVYADVARQIGGDQVQVTSIINDPNQDPHSYQATPQNQLALSKARVIIENGGGYDDFIDVMRHSAARHDAVVLNAVAISGRNPADPDLNEHVWYDFPAMRELSAKLADALVQADPASAATFRANAAAFTAKLAALGKAEAAIRAKFAGAGVAVTEPVPLYLLEACGLDNRTPAAFSQAIEEGTGVPPRALNQMLGLVEGKKVALLAYNEQTSSPETEKVLDAARQHGVAVVPVTETLPPGQDYLSWMTANVTAVDEALHS